MNQLLLETIFNISGGNKLAFQTGKWRIVNDKGHAYGRLIDTQCGQSFDIIWIAQCV